MKTERRHELQTNILADWIGKHLQQSQGHGKTILAVILLVIAAAIVGTYLAKDNASRSQASWNQFFVAFGQRDPEALDIVASGNQGTTAGVWAQLAEADLKLAEGIGDLYTNRDNAKVNLDAAEKSYQGVEQSASDQLLKHRAWFGLGQVYESTSQLDKAKEYYGKLVSSAATSALGKEASRRAEALNDSETVEWHDWFANQTPRPPVIPGMPGGMPSGFPSGLPGGPGLPNDLENLSDRPDLSIPNTPPASSESEEPEPTSDSPESEPELNSPATTEGSDDSESKGDKAAADKSDDTSETEPAKEPAASGDDKPE